MERKGLVVANYSKLISNIKMQIWSIMSFPSPQPFISGAPFTSPWPEWADLYKAEERAPFSNSSSQGDGSLVIYLLRDCAF